MSTFLSGPFGSQVLADLGAEVLKVEPLAGDFSRSIHPHFVGKESAYFLSTNRSKRSIAVDLKSPEGLQIVLDLIDRADIVIENFRPGVCDRLGLNKTDLRSKNPSLIWASISGFGQNGPLREQPAYDMVVQAMSGVMSLTGEQGRPAVRLGIPAGDLVSGLYCVIGILAALSRRAATGIGSVVDISMLDCQLAMLSYQASYALVSGKSPGPQGAGHDSIPTYRSFKGSDSREFVVTANTERMWTGLCDVLEISELVHDPRFLTGARRLENKSALWEILETEFAKHRAETWVSRLQAQGIPASLVFSVLEALENARAYGRDMVLDLEDGVGNTVGVVGNPIKLGSGETETSAEHLHRQSYPPRLGEHSVSILESLEYGQDRIEELIARGVVSGSQFDS